MKKLSLLRSLFLTAVLGTTCSAFAYSDDGSSTDPSSSSVQTMKTEAKAAQQNMPAIDINTADAQTLAEVKGIGPKRAEAIVKYRDEHGKFSSTEDLQKVSGIGPSIYKSIENRVTVGN